MRLTIGATGLAVAAACYYLLACWLFPFAACLKCHGDGKKRSASGRAWRACRRCKGSGRRLRLGRKVANWLRGTVDDAA